MKTGVSIFAIVVLLAAVALAAEGADDGRAVGNFFTRKLKGDSWVDCKPKEKDCPYGYYCVYYPDQKCKTEKECKTEKVSVCKKYKVYYETTHYPSDHSYDPHGKKETKCVEYGYEEKENCYDKQVCFEYICGKVTFYHR